VLIQRLELENIKSYRKATFEFKEGVHFISGENGSGKTTLIEAIGFALFDAVPAKKYEYFVRQGERRGTVRVRILADDEREYLVERRCSPRGHESWSVWDVENDCPVDTHGSEDVVDFLRAALNARSEHRLSDLYHELIAIPQGMFTAPFLLTPTKRKEIFDALLRVDAYRNAFTRTEGFDNVYRTRIEGLRSRLETLRRETEVYDERLAERARLRDELDTLRHNLEREKARLSHLDALLHTLDQKREALQAAHQNALQAHNEYTLAVQRRETAAERLKEAEEARRICDEHRAEFEAYSRADARQQELLKRNNARKALIEALRQGESDYRNEETRLAALLERKAERLAERNETAQGLSRDEESLQQRRANADAALHAAQEERSRRERALERLALLEEQARALSTLNDLLDREERFLSERAKEREEYVEKLREVEALRSLAERFSEDRRTYDEALARVKKIQTLRDLAEQHRRSAKGGNCPILGEPCQNVGGNLELHFVRQLSLYESELEAPTAALREAEAALNESEAARERLRELETLEALLASLDQQIAERRAAQEKARQELPWNDWERSLRDIARDVIEASQDAEAVRQEHQELIALRRSLSEEKEIASLRRRLSEAVLRVRSIHQRWKAFLSASLERAQEVERNVLKDRAALDERQEALNKERAKLAQLDRQIAKETAEERRLRESLTKREAVLAAQREELATYNDVEPALDAVHETLKNTRDGFNRYQQHLRDAEALEERREAKDVAERFLALAEERAQKAKDLLAERKAEYDAAERDRVAKDRDAALQAVERSEGHARELEASLLRLDEEIARLQQRRDEIATLEADLARAEKARDLAKFLRTEVLNKAAEGIATAYRERVSEYATTLYRRLSRENVELHWLPDYDILLRGSAGSGTRERRFEQLSGGEQMSAALAVRLALLRLLSGMSLAIFDEPTTNLDSERRERLAQALPELRNVCRQLFVVSHDDAFDSVVDEVIRIEKTPDGSRRVDS